MYKTKLLFGQTVEHTNSGVLGVVIGFDKDVPYNDKHNQNTLVKIANPEEIDLTDYDTFENMKESGMLAYIIVDTFGEKVTLDVNPKDYVKWYSESELTGVQDA